MSFIEEFRSAGVLPTGPCSAWPEERNIELHERARKELVKTTPHRRKPQDVTVRDGEPEIKATPMQMAKGLFNSAGQAMRNGKVSAEIRAERMATCEGCPFFNHDSRRCSDCGCFMEAKTWIGGNPNNLCPQKKWKR